VSETVSTPTDRQRRLSLSGLSVVELVREHEAAHRRMRRANVAIVGDAAAWAARLTGGG